MFLSLLLPVLALGRKRCRCHGASSEDGDSHAHRPHSQTPGLRGISADSWLQTRRWDKQVGVSVLVRQKKPTHTEILTVCSQCQQLAPPGERLTLSPRNLEVGWRAAVPSTNK